MIEIAIIGGTGVYDPRMLDNIREVTQDTPYGKVSLTIGQYDGQDIAFIPRHGSQHSVPPHLINYRANIMGLKQLGVKSILATAAVGSLNLDLKPGMFVLADQFLDFTKNRTNTFYEGGELGVFHCDMTVPYCPELRQSLTQAAQECGFDLQNGGTYVCAEGPRFETAAEISMFKQLGGDLVGMTSVPEVCLAREMGICYANISIITNYAAGISPSILTHSEVLQRMKESTDGVRKLILESIKYISRERTCDCVKILEQPGVNK
ncbi:MAG: S-methyl-5'-thioadenosine phosphorylase [Syntrophomonadaceae bacterium]|jgi:5'-methylthioadenosine phosphorylase|nr:S-methyl-5'-thioadenosine phosphorylase [Syntrophomonadaceae bacterium]